MSTDQVELASNQSPSNAVGRGLRIRFTMACLIFSACSIVYELLIAKLVAKLTGSPMIWESITIGIYVAALGLGVWLFQKAKAQEGETNALLMRTECYLAILGASCVPLIYGFHILYRMYIFDGGFIADHVTVPSIVFFAVGAQLVVLVIGLFSGMELPALIDHGSRLLSRQAVAYVLAVYHFGTLLGTMLFAWVGLPNFSPSSIAVATALMNLVGLGLLVSATEKVSLRPLHYVLSGLAVSVIVACVLVGEPLEQLQMKNFYYNKYSSSYDRISGFQSNPTKKPGEFLEWAKEQPTITRIRSKAQYIDIVPIKDAGDLAKYAGDPMGLESPWQIHMDGQFQIASYTERDYHEFMAHVAPMFFDYLPRNILIIGAGDGLLARELLKYGDRIDKITMVEYDPVVIRLATEYEPLVKLNENALDHEKVNLIVDDAFAFLRMAGGQYDAVYVDVPYPFSFDAARLYSIEFLQMVRAHLKPHGFIVYDMPIELKPSNQTIKDTNEIFFHTIAAAGFPTVVAYDSYRESFVAARPVEDPPRFRYVDQQIPLYILDASFLERREWRTFKGPIKKDRVHTIARPLLNFFTSQRF